MRQILCFGDSNTWGYNPKTGNRFAWGTRWTSLLQERIGIDNYRVIAEGLCGRTTVFEDELRIGRKGIDALPFLLESHSPLKMIILMLGTNDCKSFYHTNAYVIGKGIESLLEVIEQYQPKAKVLLIAPIHLGGDVWKREYDPEFDEKSVETSYNLKEEYRKIAKKHQCAFLAASDVATCSQDDMEHMDAENHLRLSEAIWTKLVEIGLFEES